MHEKSLDSFTKAYILAALWWDAETLDEHYAITDVEFISDIVEDCSSFQKEHQELLSKAYKSKCYDPSRAGHDYWFTRNNHGVGFWDRSLGAVGEQLTAAADKEGMHWPHVDDGKVYFTATP